MTSNVSKVSAERNQRTLLELVAQPGNDVCADCKSRNPRWASWSLGIFICVQCAAIHRKIGTHITKVKSLTLDTWNKDQVDRMKDMGNVKSNQRYNPDEVKNPLPTNMIEQERDSDLEKYIRGKYEFKKFMDRSAVVAAHLGPSRSKASLARPQSTPLTAQPSGISASTTLPSISALKPYGTVLPGPRTSSIPTPSVPRSTSQPIPAMAPRQTLPPQQQQQPHKPLDVGNSTWNDLLSLQAPSTNSSLPLQFAPQPLPPTSASPSQAMNLSNPNQFLNPQAQTNPYMQMSTTPDNQGVPMQQQSGGFNTMGMSSSFGVSPFDTMQRSNSMGTPSSFTGPSSFNSQPNPFTGQQFTGQQFTGQQFTGQQQPFQTQSFQPQQTFQTQQQFQPQQPSQQQPPMMQSNPHNPFFQHQQQQQPMQMNGFANQQQPQQFNPFAQQQQQQPGMFTPGNPFNVGGGWQGQPQGGFQTQPNPWG